MNSLGILRFFAVALCISLASATAQEPDFLKGSVVILSADGDGISAEESAEVNVDGLVVIKIHDKGSAPIEDVKVINDRSLKFLGKLRGIGIEDGKPLMGGGYMVCLLKAVSEAETANIKISYKTAQHVGGETESESYKVKIIPFETD